MKEELRDALAEFDGRSTTLLTEAENRFGEGEGYIETLLALTGTKPDAVSDGATWLLKSHMDAGGALSSQQVQTLISSLEKLNSWAAQLHICQIVHRLTFAENEARLLADWASSLLTHKRPFVRAWALDSIVAIARGHEFAEDKARNALAAAESDDAASVRARARNLSI